jgi:hypothetical protein
MKAATLVCLFLAMVLPTTLWAEKRLSGAYQVLEPAGRLVGGPERGEVALDVCGGRDKVYLQTVVDPTNINLLWSMRPVGEHVMFVSRVAEMALDANAGVGNPYPRPADATNINHLWLLAKVGDHYMIWSAVSNVVLDANGGRGRPYLSSNPDPRNVNHLWSLRPVGDHYMLVPKGHL